MSGHEIRQRFVQAGDLDLNVAETGRNDAPVFLLLHGLYDRWQVWEGVMQRLASDFAVVAPDLRGHGQSSKPATGYDLADYAADTEAMIGRIDRGPVHVAGHSLGAQVAIHLAVTAPRSVRTLMLIDPPFEQSDATREWLVALLEAKRGSEQETYEALRDMLWHLDEPEWRRQTEWLRATADGPFLALIERDHGAAIIDALGNVRAPTLLAQADPSAGAACSDAGAERAMRSIAQGRLARFLDTGHSIHRERPSELAAAMMSFLTEQR